VARQSIEHLLPQRVALRDAGVVEIICAVVRHSKLRHHASRPHVCDGRMRHDLCEAHLLEAGI